MELVAIIATKSGTKTADIVGDMVGLKGRQVRNYVRLTYLIPQILELVDQGKIQFVPAVDLILFRGWYKVIKSEEYFKEFLGYILRIFMIIELLI